MYNLIKLQKHACKSKSGRRKCSMKCFNADYAMPYDEGS